MAHWTPTEAFEQLKSRTSQAIQTYFPIEGTKHVLDAKRVWVEDDKSVDDIRDQKEVKLKGRTWAVPVKAELELKDKLTGKVLDRQVVNVAQLPKVTRRYTYIVNGNEYQVSNLFRMKSGVYTRFRANGELTSQWNLAKGKGFDMDFNPANQKMSLKYGDAQIPLYPVLKTLGVDDDTIERSWGKDIFNANKTDDDGGLKKFYRSFKGTEPESPDKAKNLVLEEFGKTVLRPDSTQLTLGKPYSTVTGSALLDGSHKMLKVSRLELPPDDRDALPFKDLYSAEDLIAERLSKWNTQNRVTRKIGNVLDKNVKVRDVINPELFGKPIKEFFSKSSLAKRPEQTNPLSFLVGNRQTTLIAPGEGGIKSEHEVSVEAQSINPSHLGFLDPAHTPESEHIGVTLQLASHVKKDGHDLKIPVFNVKTGKKEEITALQALKSNLAFPDQYEWKGGAPKPAKSMVKVSDPDGTVTAVRPKDVDYIINSSKGMFDLSANLIPFLQNNQGNRAMTAVRQLEQAIALKQREAPLVQVRSDKPTRTFEEGLGAFASHVSPVNGVVKKVDADRIIIKGEGGKQEVQLYQDFPLNDDKTLITSKPIVSVGDKVSKGQVVADSNFTKDGVLALGTNLRVAYMPWKGYNFEDAVVISDSAAKKLTSEHMFRENVSSGVGVKLDKTKFLSYTAGKVTKEQADKLDDHAIVREGQVLKKDDVVIGLLREEAITPDEQKLGKFSKGFIRPWKPREIRWEKEAPGVVSKVVKHGKDVTVYIKAETPADIGDKVVGRHGNKGIVSMLMPDHEMPRDKDGRPVDVLLNPAGVPGRINLGQVLETAAGKIAEKTGKPYVVNNFDPKISDYTRHLKEELKQHGVSDTEDLYDPVTKRVYPKVLVGPQYLLKLHHTADKGITARSRDAYDSNMLPSSGGPKGGQTMDAMGHYALLAHNARENIREMQSYKSDSNDLFWAQLQAGDSIPTPKIPFVFKKFEGYLKGLGLDLRKEGNELILQPLTDKSILEMSNGALTDAGRALLAKNTKEESKGIFDPKITGGMRGTKWSHIPLPVRVPNPVFERPIISLLGLTQTSFDQVVSGDATLDGKTGPTAISAALKKIDVKAERETLEKSLPELRGNKLDKANKQLKYLRAIEKSGLTPAEAYSIKNLPVLPPIFRPVTLLENGAINYDDVTRLYNHVGMVANKLKEVDPALPVEEGALPLQNSLYDGVKAVMLSGGVHQGRHRNSIIQSVGTPEGKQPKEGFFQDKVIGRRQDLSMRGVIIPEPSLSLDEVGLPRKAATEIYKPFVVRRLVQMGHKPLEAQEMVKSNHPAAITALENVVDERPVLLKRDPVLHKFGVMAFRPKLIEGKAIKIHPLVTTGYGADFDGDKMSAFVPVSPKAVKEAYKMMPSYNLFNPTTGYLMNKPGHESLMGLFKLTEVDKKTLLKFPTVAEAARAVKDGKIGMNDWVSIEGLTGDAFAELKKTGAAPIKTSVGRLMLYQALPDPVKNPKLLTDPNYRLDKKELDSLLTSVAKQTPKDFGFVADRFKDLGNEYATGSSISLDDFLSDKQSRDPILQDAVEREKKIRAKNLHPEKKKDEIVKLYVSAADKMSQAAKSSGNLQGNRMFDWVRSGARGNWDQFKQMIVAPVLVADSRGKPVPIPIPKSYSEGLDTASYFAAMHGARMGTIGKVQGTQDPGVLSKLLVNTTMNQLVVGEDCGTSKGVVLPIDNRDVLDRFTAVDIDLGNKAGHDKGKIPAGTLVTPDVLNRLKNNKIDKIEVRSPLKCVHGKGLCAKCYGVNEKGDLPSPGTNLGIIASQALGEPATQLSMKLFHCNHADSIVFVRRSQSEELPFAITLEDLFELVAAPVEKDGSEEVKQTADWEVYDGGWVGMRAVRRHAPSRPMKLVSDGNLVTICQDNHPLAVWENLERCVDCGYHRLKKLSSTSQVKTCPKCGKHQQGLKEKVGDQELYLSPGELEKGTHFVKRELFPFWESPSVNPLPLDPYLVGAYVAEGCVCYRYTSPAMRDRGEKKPYTVSFSQNPGAIRDKIASKIEEAGWHYRPTPGALLVHNLELGQQFAQTFGRYSHKVSLPPDFIWYPKTWLSEFLAGLIDGDGTVGHSDDGPDHIAIDTTSFALAQQVALIGFKLGLVSTIVVTTGRDLTRHQGFKIRVRMTELAKTLLESSLKVRNVERLSPDQTPQNQVHRKITLVRDVMYTDRYVYDATTETGTLTVGGIKSHNTGGVVGAKGSGVANMFNRLQQLLNVPETLPGSATLADVSGKVERVDKDSAGGWRVHVNGASHYVPASRELLVRKGEEVKRGDSLSSGPKNPIELLHRTNITAVQNYLTNEIWDTYKDDGPVRRRNVETVVRAMTNLGEVTDPGDHDTLLRGDRVAVSEISAFNRGLRPGMRPVQVKPVLKGINVLPLELQTDWIARLQSRHLKRTILDAASERWSSQVHGTHPIPGMAVAKEFGQGTEKEPWLY